MRAVILVPRGPDAERLAQECIDWCEEEGLPVAEVLIGRGWRAAVALTMEGRAEVIVIARTEHLRPDRVPQVRIVEEERARARRRRRPGDRRPNIIDR